MVDGPLGGLNPFGSYLTGMNSNGLVFVFFDGSQVVQLVVQHLNGQGYLLFVGFNFAVDGLRQVVHLLYHSLIGHLEDLLPDGADYIGA